MPPEVEQLLQLRWSYWILQTLAMMLTALLIPGLKVSSIFGPFLAVVTLAFINTKVWDAALFMQIPDQFSVQTGLLLLTNGAIFWVIVKLLPGIEISGILPALLAPIVFTVSSVVMSIYAPQVDWLLLLDQAIDLMIRLRDYFHQYQAQSGTGLHIPTPIPSPGGA